MTMLEISHVYASLNFVAILWNEFYHLHFIEEGTEEA